MGYDAETWALDEDDNEVPGTRMRCIGADRCKAEWLGGDRCVGVAGHSGKHWRYNGLGWYRWWRNDDTEEQDGIAGGITPPSHARYVHPIDRAEETHIAHSRWAPSEEAAEPYAGTPLEKE